MKYVTLKRNQTSEQGTFGKVFIEDNPKVFFSGELPWRDNKTSVSCIPTGQYVCKMIMSPKRGYEVYLLLGTEPRTAVEIHSGNFCGDVSKGYKSHVEGCILLGNQLGQLDGQNAVVDSRSAITEFIEIMEGKDFLLKIEEHYGANV